MELIIASGLLIFLAGLWQVSIWLFLLAIVLLASFMLILPVRASYLQNMRAVNRIARNGSEKDFSKAHAQHQSSLSREQHG